MGGWRQTARSAFATFSFWLKISNKLWTNPYFYMNFAFPCTSSMTNYFRVLKPCNVLTLTCSSLPFSLPDDAAEANASPFISITTLDGCEIQRQISLYLISEVNIGWMKQLLQSAVVRVSLETVILQRTETSVTTYQSTSLRIPKYFYSLHGAEPFLSS